MAAGAWRRNRPLRYLMVGAFNTAFGYGVYCAAVWNGLGVAAASAVSLAFGVFVSFATQSTIVFQRAGKGAFARFVLNWAVLYLLYVALVSLLVRLGTGPYVGGAIATATTTLLSYFSLRDRVFRVTRPDFTRTSGFAA